MTGILLIVSVHDRIVSLYRGNLTSNRWGLSPLLFLIYEDNLGPPLIGLLSINLVKNEEKTSSSSRAGLRSFRR